MSEIQGTLGDDTLVGTNQADVIVGDGGDDHITGGKGDDVLYGGKSADAINDDATINADAGVARVTFMGESAGYRNAVGVYKVADDGTIYDVEILFANASQAGSGGTLVPGESSVDVKTTAGQQLGFFVLSDGYSFSAALLDDATATYTFRNASGAPANVNDEGPVVLVHTDTETGAETIVTGRYGADTYHSVGSNGNDHKLNNDGVKHSVVDYDPADKSFKIGFEDLKGGGDRDYDDAVFTVEVIKDPAPVDPTGPGVSSGTDDDVINAGDGDDIVRGGSGNDTVAGEKGDDELFGDSGDDVVKGGKGDDLLSGGEDDDVLHGGNGEDTLVGGKDNDTLYGDKHDDTLNGDSGDDLVDGGDGNDTVKGGDGNDTVIGGKGDDELFGGKGNDELRDGDGNDVVTGDSGDDTVVAGDGGSDSYSGGSGFDKLDYSEVGGNGLKIDLSKGTVSGSGQSDTFSGFEHVVGSSGDDTIKGSKNADTIDGGAGDDVIRGYKGADVLSGGEGSDVFAWERKDVDGVDTITDFDMSNDTLDFRNLIKATNYDDASDVVRVEQTDAGSVVSVYSGSDYGWQTVVMLGGVQTDVDQLYDDGLMLL